MANKTMTDEEQRQHSIFHTKENSWWLMDAMGIPCARVCDAPGCEEAVRARYNPGIFDAAAYDDVVDEPVD